MREQLEKELKRNFFDTVIAKDGMHALKIFQQEQIDIILLDVGLPDMDGLEILKKVKAEKPDCEVIIVTGFGNQDLAIKSLRWGAIDYIEKPLNIKDLHAALGRAQEKLSHNEELGYKNTLLVIDDEQDIVKHLTRFLENEGFQVFGALSGKEGISIIKNNKVDVVLTDINMADMNGIEVLKQIKKLYPDIEGIVVTGRKDQDLAIKSLRAGAIDYLVKPFDLDELLISVSKALERIKLNRNELYRNRELKISTEIISKMNEELERRVEERSKKLNQVQVQLFQTSKLATLGEMAAGLAHEMNQPLGGISLVSKGFSKMLERGKLTEEEIKSGLIDIDTSVKRMSKIIQHIRIFARQDALKFTEINVNDTIESAFSLMSAQLRLHEVNVVNKLDENLPKIKGEPNQLEQVWINFISNARDSIEEKAKLISEGKIIEKKFEKSLSFTTRFDVESKMVQVIVTDNGMGISEEKKKRIFEPFFTTKEVGKGSGLGLSISYGIIEGHNGKIEIESEEGKGATMKVSLLVA